MDSELRHLTLVKPDRKFKQKIDNLILEGNNAMVIEILQSIDKFARKQNSDFYETAFIVLSLMDNFDY